jgi:NitT/TauT family transport system substrate-binding protein
MTEKMITRGIGALVSTRRIHFLFTAFLVTALLLACSNTSNSTSASTDPQHVVIAYLPGTAYASLIVIKEQKTLEKQFPHTKFEWKTLSSSATVRDGMIADQIQVGTTGSSGFLVGWDKGVKWHLVAALNKTDQWLMVKDPRVKSLKDFTPDMKIAVSALDSQSALVVRKGAQLELGDAHALDKNFVVLANPLGLQSLLSGQIAGHMTAIPYQFQESAAGAHTLLKSYDLFGANTLVNVAVMDNFYNQHIHFCEQLYQDIADAAALIKTHPDQAAQLLQQDQKDQGSVADFQKWLTAPDVSYDTVPTGFAKYAQFMRDIDMISKVPTSMQELEFPMLHGAGN